MKRIELEEFLQDTKRIPGWLSFHDAAVLDGILSHQSEDGTKGNLLEIGVYAGKSAVLLGHHLKPKEEFHVCDIFGEPTDSRNTDEILQSYRNLSRVRFEENCNKFIGELPIIHECLSLELPRILEHNKFRLIHIDGSHLYEHVVKDLEFATSAIDRRRGIIAVDDFRAQHTVGVAIAVWKSILTGTLIPLVITPAKIYLGSSDVLFDFDEMKEKLDSLKIQSVYEDILGNKILRTFGLRDDQLYATTSKLSAFIPPILTNLIRKSYLWKRLRNR